MVSMVTFPSQENDLRTLFRRVRINQGKVRLVVHMSGLCVWEQSIHGRYGERNTKLRAEDSQR